LVSCPNQDFPWKLIYINSTFAKNCDPVVIVDDSSIRTCLESADLSGLERPYQFFSGESSIVVEFNLAQRAAEVQRLQRRVVHVRTPFS
jgi:hypothetical protein